MFYRIRVAATQERAWFVLAIGAGIIAYIVAQPLFTRYLAAQHVSVIPFTLTTEGSDFQLGPEGRSHSTHTIARRSDGAIVDSGLSGLAGTERMDTRKLTLPRGEVFTIADKAAVYVKWPVLTREQTAAAKERLQHPPQDCKFLPTDTVVSHETILGREVVALSRTTPGGDRLTLWRAPDLGCESLKVRSESLQPDGSYKLKGETRPVSLVIGDPDPALFQVPGTYANVKPSELMRKEFDRVGAPWTPDIQEGADRADASYSGQPWPQTSKK